jgi:hypothetical protein
LISQLVVGRPHKKPFMTIWSISPGAASAVIPAVGAASRAPISRTAGHLLDIGFIGELCAAGDRASTSASHPPQRFRRMLCGRPLGDWCDGKDAPLADIASEPDCGHWRVGGDSPFYGERRQTDGLRLR